MRTAQSRRASRFTSTSRRKREGRSLWRNDGRELQSAARCNFRHTSALSRRDASELCVVRSPRRAWGMPDAQCIRSRAWCVESTRVSHHGRTGKHPAFPHANGFNSLLRALPGDRALLPPSSADNSANLMPASGHQDHTPSPSAHHLSKKPLDGFGTVPPKLQRRRVQRHSSFDTAASTASRPNVRDDRETPLFRDGMIRFYS